MVFLVVIGCWSCAFLASRLAVITLSRLIPDPAPADVIVAIVLSPYFVVNGSYLTVEQ
ncbi:hypothetical protein D3C77_770490 [compost metagenome]